jgi:hypothetical protein
VGKKEETFEEPSFPFLGVGRILSGVPCLRKISSLKQFLKFIAEQVRCGIGRLPKDQTPPTAT